MPAGHDSAAGDRELLELDSRQGRWLVATTVLGSAVVQLEATVVNVALPAIGRDLGGGVAALQWTLNGYLLALAALILLGGSLGDRFGRRRLFVLGTVWFTAASAVCAVAPTVELLVAARVLQGIGGALLTPGSLALLDAALRREDRPRAIGVWSALGGISGAIGPLVGGVLVDNASWRWVFLINVPLGIAVVVLAGRHVPESRAPDAAGRFDVPGAALATLALAGATFGLVRAGEEGFTDPGVLATLGAGIAATIAFLLRERATDAPMLPLDAFASGQFAATQALTFVVYAALGGVFFLLVVVLQTSLGYSALAAGAASLPVTALMLAGSARAGALAQRIGPRLPLTFGPLLLAAGMLLMTRIEPGAGYVAAVLPAVVVFGAGLTLTVAPVTSAALASAPDEHAGVASGVNNAVARTAQLVAIAVLPLVAGLSADVLGDPAALAEAFDTAMLAAAGLAAAGAVLAFTAIRSTLLTAA